MGAKQDRRFIKGIGKQEDQFIIILDIDKVFSSDEVLLMSEAETTHATEDVEAA